MKPKNHPSEKENHPNQTSISWVVLSNIFYFHPTWGFMIQFDEHIFQMGWFNHQFDAIFGCRAEGLRPQFIVRFYAGHPVMWMEEDGDFVIRLEGFEFKMYLDV